MSNMNHIIRKVPDSFHELCVNTLPNSCNQIYQEGFLNNNYIDEFNIITRDTKKVWSNKKTNGLLPGEVLKEYLNNPLLSLNYNNDTLFAKQAFFNEAQGLNKEQELNELLKLKKE